MSLLLDRRSSGTDTTSELYALALQAGVAGTCPVCFAFGGRRGKFLTVSARSFRTLNVSVHIWGTVYRSRSAHDYGHRTPSVVSRASRCQSNCALQP